MKKGISKITFISALILGIVFLLLSLLRFDHKLGELVIENYYKTENAKQSLLSIHFSNQSSDPETLKQEFITFLDQYNLNAHYSTYDMIRNENIVFVYSSDPEYRELLYTEVGRIKDLQEFTSYSTAHQNPNTKLLGVLSQEIRTLYSIKNTNHGLYNIKDFHEITANDMSLFNNDIQILIQTIENEFSEHQVLVDMVDLHHYSEYKDPTIVLLILAASMIVGILIANLTFKHVKEISLLKLEGSTSRQIFKNCIGFPLLFGISIIILLNVFIYFSVLKIEVAVGKYFLSTLFSFNLIGYGTLLITSALTILFIKKTPVYAYIKGKNNLMFLSKGLDITKMIIITLIFYYSVQFIHDAKTLFNITVNYQEYSNHYQDTYIINKFKPGYQRILDENDQLEFLSQFEEIPRFNGRLASEVDFAYSVSIDRNFLEFHNIPFIPGAVYTDKPEGLHLKDMIFDVFNITPSEIILLENVPIYDLNYGYQGHAAFSDKPILYFVQDAMISESIFKYTGSIEEAQEFIDTLFENQSMPSPYIVTSFKGNADILFQLSNNTLIWSTLIISLLLTLYLQITYVSNTVYRTIFDKEDALEYFEGRIFTKSFRQMLSTSLLSLILILCISLFLKIQSIGVSIILVILLLSLDILIGATRKRGIRL